MRVIRPRPSPSDLWDCYTRLSAGPKLVLRLKSLVFLPTGKTVFLECLTRAGLRAPDGKAWSSRSLNAVLDDLLRQGLLTEDLACAAALLHPAAVDAAASTEGEQLMAAVRHAFPVRRSSPYYSAVQQSDGDALRRLIRLAVYANDAAAFTANRDLHDKECSPHRTADLLALLFSGTPLAADWLASRHPLLQLALFDAKLSGFFATGVPGPDVLALIDHYRAQQDKDGFAAVRPVLLHYDLLAGRLESVRQGIAGIEDATDVRRMALEGALAFLEGRNEAAVQHYRGALKLRRKQVGKRKVFLDGVHGLFFVMALLHANDAALQAEIQAGLDAIISPASPYAGGFLALQALLWLVQGLGTKARELLAQLRAAMPAEPLSAACIALAEHAVDADLTRAHRADLSARFAQLKDVLPLIARIHAELLAEAADAPGPYQAYFAGAGQDVRVAFTGLVQTRQPWERALESLDAFLASGTAKANASKGPGKPKRLVWFLDPETQDVEVAEQSARGKEGWTDGRPVALKRLHERDPRLDYLTEQDRVALRTLRKETAGWYGDVSYYFDAPRTIPALVGHPTVFDARRRSQHIELVRYPLELVVTERRGGYHVALSHTADAPTVFLEPETPTRFRVVEFPQQMLAVQEILGRRGLVVPKDGRDRLVALVQRDNPTLPIRAEIDAVAQEVLEGIATPVVQLVPYGEGLKLTLVVRPFGAEGPAYVAGLGGRSVLASLGGQQRRANRDLARELAERSALVAACPTLRDRGGADAHEVVIEDPEGCLELLLELQAYAGPVSVEWPEGKRLQVSPLTPDKLKLQVGQDRDWFSVDGTVALDEDQVLEMRFLLERLDRARGRFVPLDDGRFVALTRQLQAQLQRLAAVSEPHRAGRRVHKLGAPALEAVLEEAGEVKADAVWTRHVARIRAAEGWTPKLPATLQAELRDYQVEGFAWLSRLARWGAGACLADDMGLGKTVQAIAVMLGRAEEGPCLVVAPTSVCPNWEAEIARFAPTLTTHRLATAGDRATLVAGLGPRDVLVCSYGLLHQEAGLLGGRPWQMAVLDEAQAIKNAETKRAQASLQLQAGFRLALTGTPVENYLDELWSLFHFVNPGLLGSREAFQKRFAGPIERDRDAAARQALRALIRPFLLRRTKAAVLSELPPRTEQILRIEMGDTERAFYEALRQRALENIAALDTPKGKRKIHILAEITRLRRACCNPALIDSAAGVPSGKLDAFLDLVEDLVRNRHKALVFSQFVGHLGLVREVLDARGISYEYLDGSTSSAERERRVAAFQAGKAELFLISLRAGGTGLNLTAADYVVHLDPWWNPAVEDQASDRAHRIGQERPVTIYRLIMGDSIEERILCLHRDKRGLASELLEGAEVTGRLSEDELLNLIRA
ncbi:DEAD/DEAH box helicase [Roseomonas chloroacetimidivorans]|uniref:DEAD/DEAH box helicase n=1 Tax=Roseomonas chloroacetimidivorans TaxID=1766656 RepID=UPI003C7562DA